MTGEDSHLEAMYEDRFAADTDDFDVWYDDEDDEDPVATLTSAAESVA